MAWPRKIYVATVAKGVYYTQNFLGPPTQPTWAAINSGLASLLCVEFHLDTFHQEDRQYVLAGPDAPSSVLYRREYGAAWTVILDQTILTSLIGGGGAHEIHGFYPDPTIDGRLWADCYVTGVGGICVYSDNYGTSWTAVSPWYNGTFYAIGSIRAAGNNIFVADSCGPGAYHFIEYSANKGATWAYVYIGSHESLCHNPLTSNKVYTEAGTAELGLYTMGGSVVSLRNDIYPGECDAMWFDPSDALHQRLLLNYQIYSTADGWTNKNSPGGITNQPTSIAPWAGNDDDQILVGLNSSYVGLQWHVIGALYGETDQTATGIAGINPDSPPYTDSIPYDSLYPCLCGVQAVQPGTGKVYTHAVAMPGYSDTGLLRGIPTAGDRSAFDALNYPLRHTDDIDVGIHWTDDGIIDLVGSAIANHDHSGDAGDGGTFDAANLTSDAASDGYVLTADGAGGAAWEAATGGGGGGTEYKMSILTFLGDLTISDNPLRLYNELTATQTIVEVFLSVGTAPTGANVIVDIHKNGTTIFTNQAHRPVIAAGTNSGTTTTIDIPSWADGDYLTAHVDNIGTTLPGSNLVVHIVTTGPGGGASTLDDLTDVNVPSPGDNDVLAWDAGAGEWVNVPASAGSGGLEGIFSVKDPTYGAVGDGTTDDTTAIQAAEAAAHATGGVLYFPPGSYSCTDIPMHRNVTIRGTNGATWIIARAGTSSLFYYDDSEFNVYGAIEDISIDGNHIADNGINFEGGIWMTMRRVLVMNCTVGLKLWGILESQLYDCVVLANGIGISLNHFDTFSGHMDANLIHLNNCYIQYNTSWGVYCINGDQLVLDGSDWEQNGTHGNSSTGGIYFKPLTSDRGLVINNCWSELNEGKGEIVIDTPTTVTGYNVIENYISYPVAGHCSYGIAVASGNKVYCKNVTVTDAAVSGFEVDAGATVYLDDCIGTISGAGTFILGRDASGITYTPAVVADWNGGVAPGNADDALDQLADRVKTLEGGGIGGQYRQFLYEVSGGTFTFLTDVIGNPLEGLQDLE